jgi:urease accessory protein
MFNFNLPIAEHAIIASLVVFGGLIAFSIKPNVIMAMMLIGIFAIFHGHAHGSEMVITASPAQYTIGFICATGLLHIIGIAIARAFQFNNKAYLSKFTGSGIIAAGIILLFM